MKFKKLKTILFVDDEIQLHETLKRSLLLFSEQVHCAKNGEEALEVYKDLNPQLIISDINMPKKNGIELCKKIKEINPQQYFIFLTAHNETNFLHNAIKLHIDGFLVKPLILEDLKILIFNIIEKIYLKEQLELKQALEEKNEFLQSIFDGIPDSITIVDKDCNLLLLNENAKNSYNEENFNLRSIQKCDLISHDVKLSDIESPYEIAVRTKKSSSALFTTDNLNGKTITEEVTVTPIKKEDEDIFGYIEHRKDVSKLLKYEDEIYRSKHYDELTNIFSEYSFYEKLESAITNSKKNNEKFAIIVFDIDNLRTINDSFGLEIGDEIIKKFAFLLSSLLKENQTVARVNSDNFVVLLKNIIDSEEVTEFIIKVNKLLDGPIIEVFYNNISITYSAGISIFPQDGETKEALIKNSNNALHYVKDNGKNSYKFYNDELSQVNFDKVILQSYLKESVKKENFELNYQPQYISSNNSYIGAEVLLRWNDSTLGYISPVIFIPMLEDLNLITKVGKWIIKTVFENTVLWEEEGIDFGMISINLSIRQLQDGKAFIKILEQLIQETKCKPENIFFEITESMLIKKPDEIINTLHNIKQLGFSLAIDDFGTGYSSLSMLKKMPISKLKIDKSFIDEVPKNENDVILTKTVISLAKNLNLDVIAEGVENIEQLEFLKKHGCYEIQGYYYSKPLSQKGFENLLKE